MASIHRMAMDFRFDPLALPDLTRWRFRVRARLSGGMLGGNWRAQAPGVAAALRHEKLEILRFAHVAPGDGSKPRRFLTEGRQLEFALATPDDATAGPEALRRVEADLWRVFAALYAQGIREGTCDREDEGSAGAMAMPISDEDSSYDINVDGNEVAGAQEDGER